MFSCDVLGDDFSRGARSQSQSQLHPTPEIGRPRPSVPPLLPRPLPRRPGAARSIASYPPPPCPPSSGGAGVPPACMLRRIVWCLDAKNLAKLIRFHRHIDLRTAWPSPPRFVFSFALGKLHGMCICVVAFFLQCSINFLHPSPNFD